MKARVAHVQTVAITAITALVSSTRGSNTKSSPKRNVASLVTKKLLQPSNEKCLDVLHALLRNKPSSSCVVGLLAELCAVSREMSIHLLKHSDWTGSLTKCLTRCSGEDSEHEETGCVLRVLCAMVSNSEEIPAEYVFVKDNLYVCYNLSAQLVRVRCTQGFASLIPLLSGIAI